MNAKEFLAEKGVFNLDTKKRYDEVISWMEEYAALRQPPVSGSLPSKDEAISVGFRKATVEGYNYRRVCREPDHDIYYSGWMDCYDWLSGNDR